VIETKGRVMKLRTAAILLSLSAACAQLVPHAAQAGGLRVGSFHPGVIVNHGGFVNRGFFRPGGGLVRPASHWWRPGGAVAAGVAIGFVSAAGASDWAGAPPGPGYCWYYTDVTRWYGFWDQCP